MTYSIFARKQQRPGRSKLESVTIRGFAGGWNAVDDDLAMAPRYCKTLNNFFRSSSGGQIVRYGNRWFSDVADVHDSNIVDQTYYNNRIISVCADGWVVSTNDAGVNTVIWSPSIASSLPGSPGFWNSTFTIVSFVPFKSQLAIHNGVDKPIEIHSDFSVRYLQDAGTGSNVNVPIGQFGCVASNYHCIAGIPGSPTEIFISAQGTLGTFPGDPAPNDAISIDVGAYAPGGAAAIRGIAGYRSFLLVFLQEITLQVQLGTYDTTTNTIHQPKFPDLFPKFGLIGSRCIITIENDVVFAGLAGLASAKRNAYVQSQLDSSTISSQIEPAYRAAIGALSDTQKTTNTFAIYDPLAHSTMLFTTGGNALVYTSNDKLNYKAWSSFSDMDFTCGCTSLLGRVFLSSGTRIFQYGNSVYGERFYANRLDDRDANWSAGAVFTAGQIIRDTVTAESYTALVDNQAGLVSFVQDRIDFPDHWELYQGESISFELEMPWFDGKDPMKVKQVRFIAVGTRGTAPFTVEMYVDNLYQDYEGTKIYDPAVTMDFLGNDAPGFGADTDDDSFGTGRRSRSAELYSFNAKFKAAKFRVIGESRKPLEIVNFSFLFTRGSYNRK